jgi:hypothetical protein
MQRDDKLITVGRASAEKEERGWWLRPPLKYLIFFSFLF